MNKFVIITLGNRDLQFKKSISKNLNVLEKNWFDENNDDKSSLTITKKMNFYEITSNIYNDYYPKWTKYFHFPMIDKTLSYIKASSKNTQIVFISTHQSPPDKQDTYYIGLIAKKYYETKGYICECKNIVCNPTNFSDLVNFFLNLYAELPEGKQVYVSNSGGTPDIRSASYFAGIFKNYQFLNINARTNEVVTQNFHDQEKMILKNTVEKMLKVYDYQGIISLPLPEHIKNIANEALNYYNLTKNIEGDYLSKASFAINLLIQTAYICYIQGRYAEALGRIYRIEEAIWYLLFYSFLKDKGWINNDDQILYGNKRKNFHFIFNDTKMFKEFLKFHFPNDFFESNDKLFLGKQSISTQSGKNFYWHFFKHFAIYSEFTNFFQAINLNSKNEPYKSDSRLNKMRNQSYLGHGFKGISKKELENLTGNFCYFLDSISNLLSKHFPNYHAEKIFDVLNEKILSQL